MARILLTIVALVAQGTGLAGALRVEVADASVVDESVTGRLMLRLVDVPWEQALEMVLAVTGLRAVEDGAVLPIMGPADAGESSAPTLGGLVGRPSGRGN